MSQPEVNAAAIPAAPEWAAPAAAGDEPPGSGDGDRRETPRELSDLLVPPQHTRNVRWHLLRDAVRIGVLVTSDAAVFVLIRILIRGVRAGWMGDGVGLAASRAFPPGFLGSWQFLLALVLGLTITGTYGSGDQRRDGASILAGAGVATLLSLYSSIWVSPLLPTIVRGVVVTLMFGTCLALGRLLVDALVWRFRPGFSVSRTVVVAHAEADWNELFEMLRRARHYLGVGRVALERRVVGGVQSNLQALGDKIAAARADTVLLWGGLTFDEFAYSLDVAALNGCRVLAGTKTTFGGVEPRGVWIGGRPLVELTPRRLRGSQVVAKRLLDLVGATAALVVLGPLMAVIAVLVRLDSPGPAIFAQTRVGARGRTFRFLKFRSMRSDAEQVLQRDPELMARFRENAFKIPEGSDPRVTRVGRWLRKTSLDELPQLFNVVRGDMSLVGPRPIEPGELQQFGHHYGGQHGVPLFLSVKPGITGGWAVSGRSRVAYPERAQLELEYIRTWSLLSDLSILVRTIPAVVTRRGAH